MSVCGSLEGKVRLHGLYFLVIFPELQEGNKLRGERDSFYGLCEASQNGKIVL